MIFVVDVVTAADDFREPLDLTFMLCLSRVSSFITNNLFPLAESKKEKTPFVSKM